jgi:hypothetical protein
MACDVNNANIKYCLYIYYLICFFLELLIPIATIFSKEILMMKKQAFKLSTLLKSFHPIATFSPSFVPLQFGIDVKQGLELKHGIDVNSFTSS